MSGQMLDAARDALEQAGLAAFVADRSGAVVGVTDDLLLIFGAGIGRPEVRSMHYVPLAELAEAPKKRVEMRPQSP